jgi:hypothetical protein
MFILYIVLVSYELHLFINFSYYYQYMGRAVA